ncbi:hypothetical protein B0H11DRAFT_1925162 [Mycena galericulata]|nr:hypothetical protein B0H11DRAFT_1925162 [Mycena galericulata]
MDTTAVRRFMASNVVWPLDKFFIPAGGLTGFLRENLRFKIFLIMTSIFTDPFAGVTVSSLTQLEMNQVRARMRDVISHVFFAAQIRQNEFRVAYSPIGVPAQAAWMFHMILTLLHIVGFEGDDITVVTNEVAEARMTEGQLAHEQVSSLLGGALATYVEETKLGIPAILDYKEYDPSAHVSLYFSRRCEPTTLAKIPVQEHRLDAYELSEMVSGWKGPIDFEIHSKDLPSSIDAVVAAEQVLNLGLPGTLDAVNNVNLQGFPYEDLRIRRARSVRAWNMPGGVADRRTKKERQSPGASSRTSKSSLTRVENLTGHIFSFKKMVPDGGRIGLNGYSGTRKAVEIRVLKIEEHGELLSSLLLSAAETGDENWEPIIPIAVYLRERIRPALFILEACCWAPGRHGERYQITPGEEALIRSWLHAIHESLVTVAMARYRAIIRLFEIPVETRLGSEEVQRYSLFAQGSYLFSILRRLVLHFPAVSMAEYVFRRRTVYHFEEMEHIASVSVIKPVFLDHLLSEPEMLDREWQPATTISDFIRERVRINVYLLQRATCGPGGLVAPRLLLSESDQSEVRLLIRRFMGTLVAKMRVEGLGAPSPVSAQLVIKFGIPAQATRCFELLLMIMARFPARDEDEKMVVELMKPPLADMLIAARSIAERSGAATDFPEYGADGNIVDSDTSFDLVPLQYILPERL